MSTPVQTLVPKIIDTAAFPAKPVRMEGVKDALIREVITGADGAPNFAMRIFDVAPGGHTPRHSHNYEHEIYVLAGAGEMHTAEGPRTFKAGDAIYVPANAEHQFRTVGDETLRFICLIPIAQNCAR
jgi:quercetin dioxygenase-like cupin family protein